LYYRDYDWDELPVDAKIAAAKFGYSTAEQWSNEIEFDTLWDELSDELRADATLLGYNKDTWCLDSGGTDTPTEYISTSAPTKLMSNENWIDLPDDMKSAATALGYTQEMWDTEGDMPVDTFDKNWDQLTEEQKNAASMLFGYTEDTWQDDRDWDDEYSTNIMEKINNKDWIDLTSEVQQAASTLGFDQNTWDNAENDDDNAPEPPSMMLMDWTQLSDAQTQAATTLGWTKQSWCDSVDDNDNGDNFSDDDDRKKKLRNRRRRRLHGRRHHR